MLYGYGKDIPSMSLLAKNANTVKLMLQLICSKYFKRWKFYEQLISVIFDMLINATMWIFFILYQLVSLLHSKNFIEVKFYPKSLCKRILRNFLNTILLSKDGCKLLNLFKFSSFFWGGGDVVVEGHSFSFSLSD